MLLDLAVAKPGETAGVKAAELLHQNRRPAPHRQTLAGEDATPGRSPGRALGNVGGKAGDRTARCR